MVSAGAKNKTKWGSLKKLKTEFGFRYIFEIFALAFSFIFRSFLGGRLDYTETFVHLSTKNYSFKLLIEKFGLPFYFLLCREPEARVRECRKKFANILHSG